MKIATPLGQIATMSAFAASFVAAFAITKLVVTLTDLAVYSKFALVLAAGYGARALWYGIVGTSFARGYAIANETGTVPAYMKYLSRALWIPFAGLAMILPVVIGIDRSFALGGLTVTAHEALAGAFLGLSIAAAGALVEVANAMSRKHIAVLSMLYPSVCQLVAVVVATTFDVATATSIAVVAAAGSGLCQWGLWRRLRLMTDRDGSRPAGDLHGFLGAHIRTMATWSPAAIMTRGADRFLVAAFLSVTEFAAFSVILLLTQGAAAAGTTVISRTWLPTIYDLAGTAERGPRQRRAHLIVRRVSYLVGACGGALVVICWWWGPALLSAVATSELSRFAPALWVAAVGATLQSLAVVQVSHGHIARVPQSYTFSRYAEAVAYLIALFILVPRYAVDGAAAALVAAGAIGCAASFVANRSVARKTGLTW